MTKLKYGLVGYPVKHSLSPAMQNAAFKESGIDAQYDLYNVEPEELYNFLGDMGKNNISGLNVTIPHKIKAKEYIEKYGSLNEDAIRLGAVNTVKVLSDGKLSGFNTDGPGFYRSLVEDLKFEPEARRVFILGAGGAAKAIAMYLGDAPSKIYIYDVDKKKAEDLKEHYKVFYNAQKLFIVTDINRMQDALNDSDLLVNATPMGMNDGDLSPVKKDLLRPGLYVYDLVYNRPMTQLVKDAQSNKAYAVTGLGMLLYQGAIAFEIWTGRTAPVEIMKRALKEALKR